MSAGSSTLYATQNDSLYALNTTNGSATLIGTAVNAEIGFGAEVSIGGVLYAGAYGSSTPNVYTLDTQTGASTFLAASPSTPSSPGVAGFWGLVSTDTIAPLVAITSAGGLTNNPTQTVSGTVDTADVGTAVTLYEGTTALGTAMVQSDGSWGTSIALTGDGTHTLIAKDIDASGNTGTSNAVIYTLDTIDPQLQSFTASDPSLTNANVVHYALTFSEPVTGVNASDFSLVTTGVSGSSIASVTPVSGSNGEQYTITVNAGTGSGTVELDLNGTGIHDLAGNPLPGGSFLPQTAYATGTQPYSVAIGDVNGDGKPDLVVSNYGSNSVSVLLGNGDGTFQQQTTYATGDNPRGIAIADVNGDGKPDVLVANLTANTVSVLLGNGDGTFQQQTTDRTGGFPVSIATGDLNGDGKPDLVVANALSGTVSALLGNGDGTFQQQATYATGSGPNSVAIGDVNGDGKLDLVVANANSNAVSLLLGNGDSTFQQQATYATGSVPDSVAIGDVNGDGKLDLVVANADFERCVAAARQWRRYVPATSHLRDRIRVYLRCDRRCERGRQAGPHGHECAGGHGVSAAWQWRRYIPTADHRRNRSPSFLRCNRGP